MKKTAIYFTVLAVLLTALAGCGCAHQWEEASCETPQTCGLCGEVQGEALGHAPGDCVETVDPVAAVVRRELLCARCGELTGAEEEDLTSMVLEETFLFTPNQFLQRLEMLYGSRLDCVLSDGTNLIYTAQVSGTQVIVQFFDRSTATMSAEDADQATAWCVSLMSVGESDAALRWAFYRACDPTLDPNSAFSLDMELAVTQTNAMSAGELFGYYEGGGLLYETGYYPAGLLLEGQSVTMHNIYASDFR